MEVVGDEVHVCVAVEGDIAACAVRGQAPDAQDAGRAVLARQGDDGVGVGQSAGVAVERRIGRCRRNVLRSQKQHLPRSGAEREVLLPRYQKRLGQRVVYAKQIAILVKRHVGYGGVALRPFRLHGNALKRRHGILIEHEVPRRVGGFRRRRFRRGNRVPSSTYTPPSSAQTSAISSRRSPRRITAASFSAAQPPSSAAVRRESRSGRELLRAGGCFRCQR